MSPGITNPTMSHGTTNPTPEEFKLFISDSPVSSLRQFVTYINMSNHIVDIERSNARKPPPTPEETQLLFSYVPNFIQNVDAEISTDFTNNVTVFHEELLAELDTLGLSTNSTKVKTQWI